jgi:hypothetical protein
MRSVRNSDCDRCSMVISGSFVIRAHSLRSKERSLEVSYLNLTDAEAAVLACSAHSQNKLILYGRCRRS